MNKSFGEMLPHIKYKDRVGAYAIGFKNNKIPVVKTSTGYFLLGGGLEKDEGHEACIKRECLEEAGLEVVVREYVCKGDIYHYSDTLGYYMHGIGYFYYVEIIGINDVSVEEDHQLVWLTVDDCIDKLFLEHQAWAVKETYQLYLMQHF